MDSLVTIHSLLRWLVLVLVVVGVGQAFLPAVSARGRRVVASVFVGLLDLQFLLGVVLLFQKGALSTAWRHVLFMILAVAAAHVLHARAKRTPAPSRRARVLLFGAPLVFILLGLIQVL